MKKNQSKPLKKKLPRKSQSKKRPVKSKVVDDESIVSNNENEVLNLNPQFELFCQIYATSREDLGNGAHAYIVAYNLDDTERGAHKYAAMAACRLLKKPKICKRIRQLLELGGLSNERVDKELLFVITQDADLNAKIAGIREYNNLQARIQKKLDVTSNGNTVELVIGGDDDPE